MNYGYSDGNEFGLGDTGLGGFNLGKIIKKVASKPLQTIAKIVTAPVRAAVAPVMQAVGLKSLAKTVSAGIYSSGGLKTFGQVTQAAGIVTVGVLAAPAVGGLLAKAGLTTKASTLLPLAKNLIANKANAAELPGFNQLPAALQNLATPQEYSKLVAEVQNMSPADVAAAVPSDMRDAVADNVAKSSPAEMLKQYWPYVAGGVALLVVLPRLMGGGQPIYVRSNPCHRRIRRK